MIGSFVMGFVLVAWALLYAMLEISIEGPVGWALAAPTWRKRSKIYGALMSGKELTGYHLVMFFLPYLFMHMPFFFAWNWGVSLFSVWREMEVLACFFLLSVCWDWWWFILNPYFGIKRFRRGEIWWHAKWIGRVPTDYVAGLLLVAGFTGAAAWHDHDALLRMGMIIGIFLAASFVVLAFAPDYQSWCRRMELRRGGVVVEDWEPHVGSSGVAELLKLQQVIRGARVGMADIGSARARAEQLGGDDANA